MGFVVPSCPSRALSLPAFDLSPESRPGSELCADCIASNGLCGRDVCRRQVLPLLKGPTGLLRLMGEALVEQKDRQDSEVPLPVSDEQAEWKKRKQQARNKARAASRKNARAVARSQRRGAFGLAKRINRA